jgi:hypothetical protein
VAVRGEVLLTQEGFAAVGGTSPRNRAVGLSQAVYAKPHEVKHLRFVAYDLPVRAYPCPVLDKQDDLDLLRSQGFEVVPYWTFPKWEAFLELGSTSLQRYEQGYSGRWDGRHRHEADMATAGGWDRSGDDLLSKCGGAISRCLGSDDAHRRQLACDADAPSGACGAGGARAIGGCHRQASDPA